MRIWTIATIAIGAVLLGGCAGDPTESAEYKSLSSELEAVQDDLDVAEAKLAETTAALGGLPEREAALNQANQDLFEQTTDLETRDSELREREKQLARREKAVGIAERVQADNTIGGDGVYRVGQDMAAGTYRSVDNVDCYWKISGDANGSDIIQNNIVTGPALVTVSTGQFFTTSDCGDWIKQ